VHAEKTHRFRRLGRNYQTFPLDLAALCVNAQRYPRDILLETDAEYQRLAEQHSKYEAELQKLSATPYLNSEDLLEEIKLKKMKLYCKDEMERIASRIQARSHSQ
jgi:uncharacterized protein YdcH (DUF465 family)